MHNVSVHLTRPSVDVSQKAGYLGGVCVEENPLLTGGLEQIFQFESVASASRFQVELHHNNKEVESIGRSPYRAVIDASVLCKCAMKTVFECSQVCFKK